MDTVRNASGRRIRDAHDVAAGGSDVDPRTGNASGDIDADSKLRNSVAANVVVCASTIESIRLLLNSVCAKHPGGIGNSSGMLGRYFMDQLPAMVFGTVPGSEGFEFVDATSPANNHGGITNAAAPGWDPIPPPRF